jgi:uncharacterized protein YraI
LPRFPADVKMQIESALFRDGPFMPNRRVIYFLALLFVLSACNLARNRPSTPEPLVTASIQATGKPLVTISSPLEGDEVVVGTDLYVSANATDSAGITRVQLIANNQIVKTVSSESATGDTSMNVLLDYRPAVTGDVKLEVIAYRGAVSSDPSVVNVTVRANQSQVTATIAPQPDVPVIDPNDPTCRALTNVPLNVRSGPSTNFPRITTLTTGTQVPIVGRIGDNSWWEVRLGNGQFGWVIQRNPANANEEFITILGNCALIPIVNPPPSPTTTPPTPTHTPTRTSTPIPAKTNTPQPADLLVVSVSGPANLVIADGETSVTGSYSVTITNNGSADTGQFTNTITVQPGGSPMELGVVGNLSANESIALTIDLTFGAVGDFTLRVDADSDDDVEEASDANNRGFADVTVATETG